MSPTVSSWEPLALPCSSCSFSTASLAAAKSFISFGINDDYDKVVDDLAEEVGADSAFAKEVSKTRDAFKKDTIEQQFPNEIQFAVGPSNAINDDNQRSSYIGTVNITQNADGRLGTMDEADQKAFREAKEILRNPEATQQQIEQAEKTLNEIYQRKNEEIQAIFAEITKLTEAKFSIEEAAGSWLGGEEYSFKIRIDAPSQESYDKALQAISYVAEEARQDAFIENLGTADRSEISPESLLREEHTPSVNIPFAKAITQQEIARVQKVFMEASEKGVPLDATVTKNGITLNLPVWALDKSKHYARNARNGYEVSSKGDSRFSALNARFAPGTTIWGNDVGGRTIESVYQHGMKQGDWTTDNNSKTGAPKETESIINSWTAYFEGGGRRITDDFPDVPDELIDKMMDNHLGNGILTKEDLEDISYYMGYLPLWKEWAKQNPELIETLRTASEGKTLTDRYASTRVSQARALAEILGSETSQDELYQRYLNLYNEWFGKIEEIYKTENNGRFSEIFGRGYSQTYEKSRFHKAGNAYSEEQKRDYSSFRDSYLSGRGISKESSRALSEAQGRRIKQYVRSVLSSTSRGTQPIEETAEEPIIQQYQGEWTRTSVENDPETLYIFTDNTDRTSGSGKIPDDSWYSKKYGKGYHYPSATTARIRGLDNARPVSTVRFFYSLHKGMTHPQYDRNSKALWHDSDFDEFKIVIDNEFKEILKAWKSGKYKRIMFPSGDGLFNAKISDISEARTPKLYAYLQQKYQELQAQVNGTPMPASQGSSSQQAIDDAETWEAAAKIPTPAGRRKIQYTPIGKETQTYEVEGTHIFNKKGITVFNQDTKDRRRIFANLAYQEGRAVVVEHKDKKYVVNNKRQIISVQTGDLMQWGEENGDRRAILRDAAQQFKQKLAAMPKPQEQPQPQESQQKPEQPVSRKSSLSDDKIKPFTIDLLGDKVQVNSLEQAFALNKLYEMLDEMDEDDFNEWEQKIMNASPSEAVELGKKIRMSVTAKRRWDSNKKDIWENLKATAAKQSQQEQQVTQKEEHDSLLSQVIDYLKAMGIKVHTRDELIAYLKKNHLDDTLRAIEEQQEMDAIKEQALANGTFMKAPNGKDTHLTERQWLQVRTKNFKNWFGDWEDDPENASKVIDENGEPLVVYHSNNIPIEESKSQFIDNIPEVQDFGIARTFFTIKNYLEYSRHFGNNTQAYFLNVRNLYEYHKGDNHKYFHRGEWGTGNIEMGELQKDGYDGALAWKGKRDEYVVATPNQIKSATDNNGMFSTENDDIQMAAKKNKKSQSTDGQHLSTRSQKLTDAAKIQRVSENLQVLAKEISKSPTEKGLITDLSQALEAKDAGASKYAYFVLEDGTTLSIRISNHNANTQTYKDNKNERDENISIVIKPARRKNTFRSGSVNLTEYVYFREQLDGEKMVQIVESLTETLQTGKYEDKTGLAKVNISEVESEDIPFYLLRTSEGDIEVYGFIDPKTDEMYLDETVIKLEHPIHEYTHLWDKALAAKNPELWKQGVSLMKQLSLWQKIENDPNYGQIGCKFMNFIRPVRLTFSLRSLDVKEKSCNLMGFDKKY